MQFEPRDRITTGPGVWKFNVSLLQNPDYTSLVTSFWSFWATLKEHDDFASLLEWWDQGRFYLREVTRSYSRSKAVHEHSRKNRLTKQLHTLQRVFERGNSSAFSTLCAIQQELRDIALHEARGAHVRAWCQWAEEGEASSSFLNLASKHKASQTMHSIRDPHTGLVHHDHLQFWGSGGLTMTNYLLPPSAILSHRMIY